jgi:hypothetical protein
VNKLYLLDIYLIKNRMKNNIGNINKIVEDINVYIDKLLYEQVDDNDAASTEVDKIISRDKGEVTIDQRSKELGTDLQTGKVSWDSVFTPQELEKFDEWEKTAAAGVGYTITFGKYAGKVLAAPVVGAYKVYQVVSGKKKVKLNPFKKKIDPDVCNCISFVKKYTSLSGDCSTASDCYEKFHDNLDAELTSLGSYETKLANEYAESCENLHTEVIFDDAVRNSTEYNVGCKTFGYMLDDAEVVSNELSSLLGRYFRIKNQKDPNRNKKADSVAGKLIMYGGIDIKFDDKVPPTGLANTTTYMDCTTHGIPLENTEHFEIMSASNQNKGKTVELRHSSNKYCLVTFDNSSVGVANAGKIRWIDSSDKTAKCPDYNWKGVITKLSNN